MYFTVIPNPVKPSNRSIWPIDWSLTGTITSVPNGPGSNSKEEVPPTHNPQSSRIGSHNRMLFSIIFRTPMDVCTGDGMRLGIRIYILKHMRIMIITMFIHPHLCVCVCVCVCVWMRKKDRRTHVFNRLNSKFNLFQLPQQDRHPRRLSVRPDPTKTNSQLHWVPSTHRLHTSSLFPYPFCLGNPLHIPLCHLSLFLPPPHNCPSPTSQINVLDNIHKARQSIYFYLIASRCWNLLSVIYLGYLSRVSISGVCLPLHNLSTYHCLCLSIKVCFFLV